GKESAGSAPLLGFHAAGDTIDETERHSDGGTSTAARSGRPSRRPGPGPRRSRRRNRSRTMVLAALGVGALALALILRLGSSTPSAPGSDSISGSGSTSRSDATAADLAVEPSPVPPVLHFSVAVASHADRGRAEAHVANLQSAIPDIPWYIAPVAIDEAVYYRVLGGFASDSSSGAALASEIAQRLGMSAEGWIVRGSDRVVDLGGAPQLQQAEEDAARLRGLGLPASVARVTYTDRSVRYRIYAGGYADPAEAGHLLSVAESLGVDADLALRLGPPTN
ncbi:MAG: SPOR domain-containing protein, partial [Gemmatimonadota bacterium]